jgi:phosphohistidine phosphatase
MKTLLLMRHAKSSWKDAMLSDHDRPLNKRGKREAPHMGRLLRENGAVPDLIISSTAKRARKTAAKVLLEMGGDAVIELRRELYDATPAACVAVLNDVYRDDDCVLLVGHNPCFEELLAALTREHRPLATAAVARIELPLSSWRGLSLGTQGRLTDFWQPQEPE